MARPREPIKVIKARGRKHLTKQETAEREAQEINVPFTNIKTPSDLSKEQKKLYRYYAERLTALGIFTELDVDCLTRYVRAHSQYMKLCKEADMLLEIGDLKNYNSILYMQDRVFKQAQSAARDLGLTITSRCRIVIPSPPEDDDL